MTTTTAAAGLASLVEGHLNVADRLARRLSPRGASLDDFVQVARLALVEAAGRFQPERGVPFANYSATVIEGRLKHHLRDRCWAVRPPRPLQEMWLAAAPVTEALTQRLGRSPTVSELSEEMGVDPALLVEALDTPHAWSADSLERLQTDSPMPWEPAVVDGGFAAVEERAWLHDAIAALPKRLQYILEMRFRQDLTQREIAEKLGISQMHVSRLLARALRQLRAAAA